MLYFVVQRFVTATIILLQLNLQMSRDQDTKHDHYNYVSFPPMDIGFMLVVCVNGPCLLDYLILKLRLPVVLYVSFAVVSR